MAADAYQGQVSYGSFAVAAANALDVCPADAPGYDPTAFSAQPGAAARANNYPRQDGQGFAAGASYGK